MGRERAHGEGEHWRGESTPRPAARASLESSNPPSPLTPPPLSLLQGISSPPDGWGLDEAPGDTLVSLTRQGILPGEIVTVELLVDEQGDDDDDEAALFEGGEDDEEEDEEDDDKEGGPKAKAGAADEDDDDLDFDDAVIFTAAVARGESALVFECRSDGSYLQVLSVSLEPNPDAVTEDGEDGAAFDDDTRYVGPLYDELDERLQAEFEAYLAARGIDAELGGFLAEYAADKEQREYVAWLGKVKAFVAGK